MTVTGRRPLCSAESTCFRSFLNESLQNPMESETHPASSIRTFNEHFNDPQNDIVLRSKENIHFRVHSIVLRNTSSFFHAMFTLPQSSSSPTREHSLHMDEEEWVMEASLRICCGMPIQIEHLRSFDTIEPLLHFCDKYGTSHPSSQPDHEVKISQA